MTAFWSTCLVCMLGMHTSIIHLLGGFWCKEMVSCIYTTFFFPTSRPLSFPSSASGCFRAIFSVLCLLLSHDHGASLSSDDTFQKKDGCAGMLDTATGLCASCSLAASSPRASLEMRMYTHLLGGFNVHYGRDGLVSSGVARGVLCARCVRCLVWDRAGFV